jgi:ADP-ribose pyrophosphatase YjhB (NUDIX family)
MSAERFKLRAAVYVIFRRQEEILLLKRWNTGFEDGNYSLVSGHLDGDEPVTVAAAREAEEESGVTINPTDLKVVHVMHRCSPEQGQNFEYVDFYLEASQWQGEPTIMEPDKCSELRWCDQGELPDNTIRYVKSVLDTIEKGVTFSEYGWPEAA